MVAIFPKLSRPPVAAVAAGAAELPPEGVPAGGVLAVVLGMREAEAGVPFVLVVAMFFRSVGWGSPLGSAVMLSLLTSWLFACFPCLPAQGPCLFRWVFGI
jgi:hypothetical protein